MSTTPDIAIEMTWDNDAHEYTAVLSDGKTIHVDGDDFSEAVSDLQRTYLEEKYPGVTWDDFTDEQREAAYDNARDFMLDATNWQMSAYELDLGLTAEDLPAYVTAWMQ